MLEGEWRHLTPQIHVMPILTIFHTADGPSITHYPCHWSRTRLVYNLCNHRHLIWPGVAVIEQSGQQNRAIRPTAYPSIITQWRWANSFPAKANLRPKPTMVRLGLEHPEVSFSKEKRMLLHKACTNGMWSRCGLLAPWTNSAFPVYHLSSPAGLQRMPTEQVTVMHCHTFQWDQPKLHSCLAVDWKGWPATRGWNVLRFSVHSDI